MGGRRSAGKQARFTLVDGDQHLQAVIEASAGSRNKFKYSPVHDTFVLNSILPVGMCYPFSFGFLPLTRGDDGDPLDVLLLMDEAAPIGVVVPCRLVGAIKALQKSRRARWQRNDRLLAVAAASRAYQHCQQLADLAPRILDEIESFFVAFNALREVSFKPVSRVDADAARVLVDAGQALYVASKDDIDDDKDDGDSSP